jgi:hypothetical protein
MANILLLGDTWAITPTHTWQHGNKMSQDWFEYQFIKKGHPCFNKGWGGNQNHSQLAQAEVFLNATKGTVCEADLVIWFHSELVRDFGKGKEQNDIISEYGFDGALDIKAEEIYETVTRLKNEFPDTKWAIIGGHAPLRSTRKHLLDWAEFRIDNWRQEISGVECPESHAFEWLEKWKGSLWDWPAIPDDIIQRESNIRNILLEATKDVNLFYDQSHPAVGPLKDLSERILDHFNF